MTESTGEHVELNVTYGSRSQPKEIRYSGSIFGMMKFIVVDGIGFIDPQWDRLGDGSLKEGFDRWVSTGDVIRSVQALPFVDRVDGSMVQAQYDTGYLGGTSPKEALERNSSAEEVFEL
mgnify:CR=1 FL=1